MLNLYSRILFGKKQNDQVGFCKSNEIASRSRNNALCHSTNETRHYYVQWQRNVHKIVCDENEGKLKTQL